MKEIEEILVATGFDVFSPSQVAFDGEVKRADRAGALNAWFWGKLVTLKNGQAVYTAKWGDWKTDEKHEWSSLEKSQNYTAVQKELEEIAAKEKEEKQKRQAEVATKAFEAFSNAQSVGDHPYLRRKGLSGENNPAPDFGQRLDRSGALLIPLRDITGKIWSLQKIAEDGQKSFFPGGKIKACFHTLWGKLVMLEKYTSPKGSLPPPPLQLHLALAAPGKTIEDLVRSPWFAHLTPEIWKLRLMRSVGLMHRQELSSAPTTTFLLPASDASQMALF
jgi:hypothetical protein